MARITYYTNSFLASAVSILGSGMMMLGIVVLLSGEVLTGLLLAVVGVALLGAGKMISEAKAFRTWWKQVEKADLIPEIRQSRETAVAVYQKNPIPKTLEKIRQLNPAAASYIENGFKEPASNQRPQAQAAQMNPQTASRPAQQPIQQAKYQPPVQQTAYQPPVQQSTYHPPVIAPATLTVNGVEYADLDAYIDEVATMANANTQNDPEVYQDCINRLDWVLTAYRDNERILRNMAMLYYLYANHCDVRTFEGRKKGYTYVLRSLTLEKKKPDATQMDWRKYVLFMHAVYGGILAANSGEKSAMEEACQWLRTAVEYRMENPDETASQYYNVAIPSTRMYVCYWLARAYLADNPANKQKARAVLEEALQACSFALIRNCDINPNLTTDMTTVLTRDQVLELWRSVTE